MQTYGVELRSDIFKTFRCQKAVDSVDLDINKKSVHSLSITCDIKTPFNVGLILGASGSGKTTLAKKIFGEDCFKTLLDEERPIIDQLPSQYSYDECAAILSGIGLTQVPCWVRPVKTLSNGQKVRAESALLMCSENDITIIDEWTSVVDRTVAKVMSHCAQKFARKNNKKIILCSCHYDVLEWLNPDWVIDCNKQTFIDRRLLPSQQRQRTEQLQFTIRKCDRSQWKYFSKYHYLNEKLPGGTIFLFGLFEKENQIGFQCFANYRPTPKGTPLKDMIFHANRIVIHPDYCGLGLGMNMNNECSKIMREELGCRIMIKFSSTSMLKHMQKSLNWKLLHIERNVFGSKFGLGGGIYKDKKVTLDKMGFRTKVKTYSYEYMPH